jgi:type I restriction enzyme M protein
MSKYLCKKCKTSSDNFGPCPNCGAQLKLNLDEIYTPDYVCSLMANIIALEVDLTNANVYDPCIGSGKLLKPFIDLEPTVNIYGQELNPASAKNAKQLFNELGVNNNIAVGDSLAKPAFKDVKFNAVVVNPPYSYDGNGMPFIEFGLDHMEKGGYGAIIVQDSAGSGKAANINKSILKKHTLVASIKMATDLFQPNAGVQTSIYVFLAGTPHDFDKVVKFIDFRKDGYKRAGRGLSEIDHPTERYQDIIKIYKAGTKANLPEEHKKLWNLEEVYVEDQITNSGADWNFEQHQKHDTTPTHEDFMKTVGDYLTWEVSQLLNGGKTND